MTDPTHSTLTQKEGRGGEGACPQQPNPGRTEINPWRAAPWMAALFLLVAPFGAHAQTDPAAPDCGRQPAPGATMVSAQAHYDSLAPYCLRNAQYYRQYGQWLLQQNNPGAAIEALERALLLEPEHLGTQLDYSQALLAVGDADSAQAILNALRVQPDVPPHLLPLMDWQLLALQQPRAADPAPPIGMTSRTLLSQTFGADNNLNNATTATNVTLTFPDADLSLPVAEAYQPLNGLTATTSLQWTGLIPHDRHIWLLQAEGRSRHTAAQATRYQQAELHATWLQDPTANTQWIGRMEHTQLHWGGRKLYRSQRLGLQHQWAHTIGGNSCRSAAGLELENRNYPGSTTLNGQYRGAVLTLLCQNNGSSINLQLRTGRDEPRHTNRVGGQQRQSEAKAQWQNQAWGNQWLAEYTLQHQQDAAGYSPLLSRNAARRITRQALRLETSRQLSWPAMGDPQWFGSMELTHQTSNLQPFGSSRRAAQTGLRWAWP